MNLTYFAHAGHEHLDEVASNKGGSALIITGIAITVVAVFVIGIMIYDSKRKIKMPPTISKTNDSDDKTS